MINPNFVYLAAAINLLASASYVAATLRGETKPNRIGWFMWSLAPLVAFAAMVSQGVGVSALMTFMSGFGPLLVFVSSFVNKQAYWELDKVDIFCGLLSLAGLVLWFITRTGNVAILFSVIADGLAAIPTIRKIYVAPQTEHYRAFTMSAIAAFITLLTIKEYSFESSAFPVYIFAVCVFMVTLGQIRLRQLARR